MSELQPMIDQQRISITDNHDSTTVLVSFACYPLSIHTVVTPEQAIDLATELIATANRIQMKEAA